MARGKDQLVRFPVRECKCKSRRKTCMWLRMIACFDYSKRLLWDSRAWCSHKGWWCGCCSRMSCQNTVRFQAANMFLNVYITTDTDTFISAQKSPLKRLRLARFVRDKRSIECQTPTRNARLFEMGCALILISRQKSKPNLTICTFKPKHPLSLTNPLDAIVWSMNKKWQLWHQFVRESIGRINCI